MQATVTMLVKLWRPNSARSGAAKPHIPGWRRPHTRQASGAAVVRRPHEGGGMVPVVFRNIVVALFLRDAIAFVEPHAEIDQAAGERAERPVRVPVPRGALPARGAGDFRLRGVAPTSSAADIRSDGTRGPHSLSTQRRSR